MIIKNADPNHDIEVTLIPPDDCIRLKKDGGTYEFYPGACTVETNIVIRVVKKMVANEVKD